MEKGYSAIGKGIGKGIGTKWVHRFLHMDLNKRKLKLTYPDDAEKHKTVTYFISGIYFEIDLKMTSEFDFSKILQKMLKYWKIQSQSTVGLLLILP